MTLLAIYPAVDGEDVTDAEGAPAQPPVAKLITREGERIAAELACRGIRFERWPARATLAEAAEEGAILAAYREEIARVQAEGRYGTVDAIRLTPDHPDREALRRRFLAEHTHEEDEVRFFVEGQGLFCLHLGDEVLQLLCEKDDWIAVPAGTRHWFDMGSRPGFCALRFFNNPDGWVARFSGDRIHERFPLLEDLLVTI